MGNQCSAARQVRLGARDKLPAPTAKPGPVLWEEGHREVPPYPD